MNNASPQGRFDMNVIYRPANALALSEPEIPDLAPGSRIIPDGSVHADGARPVPLDIEILQDVAIPLRDGLRLYGDVYRGTGTTARPAILIYTVYSKQGGWWNTTHYAANFGVPKENLSGLQAFEALDPAYWCAHGYALVVVDARGTGHSEGDMVFVGEAAGRDVYDTVEWIADQEWCTGKVGMAGNSYLAMVQWAAAALQPPHLSAIAPWEGLTDVYRDAISRGGIPDTAFHDEDIIGHLYGTARFEDVTAMLRRHPTTNAYWADKRADLTAVDIPAYVVSSWSNGIHTRGTQQAFQELGSDRKWLRVHDTMEWHDIADPESIADLRRFFDRYLKDEDNSWESTPPVRYAVLDPGHDTSVHRTAATWPPAPLEPTVLYLDAASGQLTRDKPSAEASISYSATDSEATARFSFTAEQDTELLGPLNVRFWAETSEGDDLDLFAAVYKVDSAGTPLWQNVMPGLKEMALQMEKDGQLISHLAYTGPVGRLRASHRALDPVRSTMLEPYLSHELEEPVQPGTPIELDLGLWPTGMTVHAGETLILEIAGSPAGPFSASQPGRAPVATRNAGTHTLHTGGRFSSRVFLPFVK
ncbi:CocE/NonD family hydrolase [Streptomyces sp. NPDC090106]|uniref:CocE/NonD family hydrolase n=1 Tax=Streptomyces sp. NPDC090106 TaxID=3365946 RepID=UPI00381D80F5